MRDAKREDWNRKKSERLGEFLTAWENDWVLAPLEGAALREVRIRMGTERDPGVLIILKASGEGGAWVAFVGGPHPQAALLSWLVRAQEGALRWREDRPWVPAGG